MRSLAWSLPAILAFTAALASSTGCKSEPVPSPMGNLTADMLAELEKDCDKSLSIEPVCGRRPWREDCDKRHHPLDLACHSTRDTEIASATKRVWCRPPGGWSIWTDRHDRVVGACIDAPELYTLPDARRLERVQRFATKYFPSPAAEKMRTFVVANATSSHVPGMSPGWFEKTGLVITYLDPDDDRRYERTYLIDHPSSPAPPLFTLCWEVHIPK